MKTYKIDNRAAGGIFWDGDFPHSLEGQDSKTILFPAQSHSIDYKNYALEYWYYTGPAYHHALIGLDFTSHQESSLSINIIIDENSKEPCESSLPFAPVLQGLPNDYVDGIEAGCKIFFTDPGITPQGTITFNHAAHSPFYSSESMFAKTTFGLLSLVFTNTNLSEISKLV